MTVSFLSEPSFSYRNVSRTIFIASPNYYTPGGVYDATMGFYCNVTRTSEHMLVNVTVLEVWTEYLDFWCQDDVLAFNSGSRAFTV